MDHLKSAGIGVGKALVFMSLLPTGQPANLKDIPTTTDLAGTHDIQAEVRQMTSENQVCIQQP